MPKSRVDLYSVATSSKCGSKWIQKYMYHWSRNIKLLQKETTNAIYVIDLN